MSKQTNQPDPLLDMFEALKETPERDPARAAQSREQFLAQAKEISTKTVSVSWFSRLKDVFGPGRPALQLSTLTIAIVIGMLLLGFSSSVVAARQAQPDQILYPYKLWLEDQRLALTSNPESRVKLHLQYAEDRLEEIRAASARPDDPGYDRTAANFDQQISAASALLIQNQLNGSLIENLERLEQEYDDLYDDDQDDLDDPDDDFNPSGQDEDAGGEQDEDDFELEELDDAEYPGKYQKEQEDSDDTDDDNGDGADDSDDSEGQNNSNDSDGSDESDDDKPDETDEPDDDDSGDDDPEETD